MSHQPSGLRRGLSLYIDANWTPEQAVAVFDLLTDLQDLVCSHYNLVIQQRYRQDRCIKPQSESPDNDPAVPF